jgi:pyruvate dehydrogenase E1 component alpha subunit
MSSEAYSFSLANKMDGHLIEAPEIPEVEATKEEMMDYFQTMYTIRRMEISCDTEYKARNIRGFCHLYDGQEAVCTGMEAALTKRDDIISTYRCHGLQYTRGDSVKRIVAELFGFKEGVVGGKGGSMHLYSKANRFWGGAAIVGAQMPIGAGLALANKFQAEDKSKMPIAVAMCGDGAVNQGQVWEAMNIAKLWGLPYVNLVENNRYGMGTSVERSSANVNYYKQGGVVVPGVRIDGQDVLAVREGMKWVKSVVEQGNPMFVEIRTYRYHGHSMSDPGTSYRTRDEVDEMRQTRDCIELTKQRIIEAGWSDAGELKKMEKEMRKAVDAEVKEAKAGSLPSEGDLYTDIYENEVPSFIRGVEMTTSVTH